MAIPRPRAVAATLRAAPAVSFPSLSSTKRFSTPSGYSANARSNARAMFVPAAPSRVGTTSADEVPASFGKETASDASVPWVTNSAGRRASVAGPGAISSVLAAPNDSTAKSAPAGRARRSRST